MTREEKDINDLRQTLKMDLDRASSSYFDEEQTISTVEMQIESRIAIFSETQSS